METSSSERRVASRRSKLKLKLKWSTLLRSQRIALCGGARGKHLTRTRARLICDCSGALGCLECRHLRAPERLELCARVIKFCPQLCACCRRYCIRRREEALKWTRGERAPLIKFRVVLVCTYSRMCHRVDVRQDTVRQPPNIYLRIQITRALASRLLRFLYLLEFPTLQH